MRRILLRTIERSPFFHVDGEPFIDLAYYYGETLTIDLDELVRFLTSAAPGEVIIGRRLVARERRLLGESRRDSDSEIHARLLPRDADRWRVRRTKTRR